MANAEFMAYEVSSQDQCYDATYGLLPYDGYAGMRPRFNAHDDDYAHRCTLHVTRFYGFDDSFRDKMVDFERRLLAAGWNIPIYSGESIEFYMTHYYDTRLPNTTVDRVPRPTRYYSDSAQLMIRIAWTERGSQTGALALTGMQYVNESVFPFFRQGDFHEERQVFSKVTRDHKYVLAMSIEGHYFQN
jgi:hypothetical protein